MTSNPLNTSVYERLLRKKQSVSEMGSYKNLVSDERRRRLRPTSEFIPTTRTEFRPRTSSYVSRRDENRQPLPLSERSKENIFGRTVRDDRLGNKTESTPVIVRISLDNQKNNGTANNLTLTNKKDVNSTTGENATTNKLSDMEGNHLKTSSEKAEKRGKEDYRHHTKKKVEIRKDSPSRIGSTRRKQWLASDRSSSSKGSFDGSSPASGRKKHSKKTKDGRKSPLSTKTEERTLNSPIKLTLDLKEGTTEPAKMEVSPLPTSVKRSHSLYTQSTPQVPNLTRKSSEPLSNKYDLNDSLPDLPENPRTNNSADRLKRDFHLTDVELKALREIVKKVDLYDQSVRDRMHHVLKVDAAPGEDNIANLVIVEKEIETLKQKLFMSRKELDSYISFTKKMEREKRQSVSEKEELETKIQWHEKRLLRFEGENKALKTERADLLNQIYELRGKSLNKTATQTAHNQRAKSMDASLMGGTPPPVELEMSKQRLMQEADAFAQERTKLIKERQRLDEEVRKVQIKCVSLTAQLQHSEKTVEEVKEEKEQLKKKLARACKQIQEEQKKLQAQLANGGPVTASTRRPSSSNSADSEALETLRKEYQALEKRFETLQDDNRQSQERIIKLEHDQMALRDTVNVVTSAKEDAENRLGEVDSKYRDTLTELNSVILLSDELKQGNMLLENELKEVSSRLHNLQIDCVQMEVDQDAFKKFLDKLSMELQEKLGEEHVSKDTEAESLQEQAEIISRQIVAHLNPARKLQEDYEAIKQDRDDLEEEIKYLKYALSSRLEIKSIQIPAMQKCECSKEKDAMKRELDETTAKLEAVENEVNRLHQDKQQLLMSFLNLQAAQRSSREVRGGNTSTDDDRSHDEREEDEGSDTETEQDSEYESDASRPNSFYESSRASSFRESFSKPAQDEPSLIPSLNIKITEQGVASVTECTTIEEVRTRLLEVTRTKDRLESERVGMLNSLCKQVETTNALKAELENYKRSRPSSVISKSESMSSITSEKCPNCQNSSGEIRSYLSIIEELTEDKLRLEKQSNDLDSERDILKGELERQTDNLNKADDNLVNIGTEKESSLKAAKEESQFLLQSVSSLKQENQALEENLRKLREDKNDILDNLRQAEEDRFGFIRTLSLITEQKEAVENELTQLKETHNELLERPDKVLSKSSNSSKDESSDDFTTRRVNSDDDINVNAATESEKHADVRALQDKVASPNNNDASCLYAASFGRQFSIERKNNDAIIGAGDFDEMLQLIDRQPTTLSFHVSFKGTPIMADH